MEKFNNKLLVTVSRDANQKKKNQKYLGDHLRLFLLPDTDSASQMCQIFQTFAQKCQKLTEISTFLQMGDWEIQSVPDDP